MLKTRNRLNGTVIVTYRCNQKCNMCKRHEHPTRKEEEISLSVIQKLPRMYFTNITGGEPFIREDLQEIVEILSKKSDRIVISTNGYLTDKIVALCKRFPKVGIRISLEGLEENNAAIRGVPQGFEKAMDTLKILKEMGITDIGFATTIQDQNAMDLIPLYEMTKELGVEYATASIHNSFYFEQNQNIIQDRMKVSKEVEKLINSLLCSKRPKDWFRAYFNHGLINHIFEQKRLLPCGMAKDAFFIDPFGDVMPCNGSKEKMVMGNLKHQDFKTLWNSKQALEVRKQVKNCSRNCWMIGSVTPAILKHPVKPVAWVIRKKWNMLWGKQYSMFEQKVVCDFRDGVINKEQLDHCSTCEGCQFKNKESGVKL